MGEQAPLAAALKEVEDRVEYLAETVGPGPAMSCGSRQVELYVVPFGIGKIRWVRLSHAC